MLKSEKRTFHSSIAKYTAEPYSLDSHWYCKLPFNITEIDEDQYCECVIIDRYKFSDNDKYLYYVNFEGYDKRMATWVKSKDLVSLSDKNKIKNIIIHKSTTQDINSLTLKGHDQEFLKSAPRVTKVRNISKILFSSYIIDCWYFSPFPLSVKAIDLLYICEYCLTYFINKCDFSNHIHTCKVLFPPGNEIYRSLEFDNLLISVFEVDGFKEIEYCQNLCLLTKLFLDDKQTYFDTKAFYFYVLTEVNQNGCHFVGFFSREKQPEISTNLACILTMPPYHRRGYGRFLISLSYLLSQTEAKTGTPEKPLSDLGRIAYTKYWCEIILGILENRTTPISISEICKITAITTEDIISFLTSYRVLKYHNGEYILDLSPKFIENVILQTKTNTFDQSNSYVSLADKSKLRWTSFMKLSAYS